MDSFKEIIKQITPDIEKLGFNKRGNTFYVKHVNNFGIINFQKSQNGIKEEVKFTINFGIYSDLLGKVVDFDYDKSKVPDVWDCQWRARIGDFMPDRQDFWWKIQTGADSSEIISNIIDKIQNIILPEIDKRLTDDDLMTSLVQGDFNGSTALETFKYLTIFLKAQGNIEALNEAVELFLQQPDGKKYYDVVKEHLEEIEYNK